LRSKIPKTLIFTTRHVINLNFTNHKYLQLTEKSKIYLCAGIFFTTHYFYKQKTIVFFSYPKKVFNLSLFQFLDILSRNRNLTIEAQPIDPNLSFQETTELLLNGTCDLYTLTAEEKSIVYDMSKLELSIPLYFVRLFCYATFAMSNFCSRESFARMITWCFVSGFYKLYIFLKSVV
jgi:hypothetical protein